MSAEARTQSEEKPEAETQDAQMHDAPALPTGPAAMSTNNKKRPRLDLATDARERKRGKTVFGRLLGTLNKAKDEDKERNASEAARKRQLIEQRLQNKLRKETDSVRRAEEAKKDKTSANRKEEDLQLKDSIHKLRRIRLPLLSNYLSTADRIPSDDSSPPTSSSNPLTLPPRSHPPPLYYLPAILTPAQEAFLSRRKSEVKEAAEKEWNSFQSERAAGIEEIRRLRERVAEEEGRKEDGRKESNGDHDVNMEEDSKEKTTSNGDGETETVVDRQEKTKEPEVSRENGAQMEVDDEGGPPAHVEEPKKQAQPVLEKTTLPAPLVASTADEDDAVEY